MKYSTPDEVPLGNIWPVHESLPISKGIITAHDGTIGARNNPEGGATFYFTLQALAEQEPPSAGAMEAKRLWDDMEILDEHPEPDTIAVLDR